MLVYKPSGCGFKSRYSHLNFRYRACLEQGVPWNSGNYRVSIHSETRTWHDKNIQSDRYHTFSSYPYTFIIPRYIYPTWIIFSYRILLCYTDTFILPKHFYSVSYTLQFQLLSSPYTFILSWYLYPIRILLSYPSTFILSK